MNFLCPQHRQQILQHPTTAIAYWEQWMQQGASLFQQRQWQQASNFLGCSFEVADWLLDQPHGFEEGLELTPIDRYMLAGHQLAEALGRCEHATMELHYLLTIHLRLLDKVKAKGHQHWMLRSHLEISLAMLRRYCQLRGQFKGYTDCYLETRLCIDQCIN